MSGKDGSGPNRTIFQPSPLQERKGAAQPAPDSAQSAGGFDSAPAEIFRPPSPIAPVHDIPKAPAGVEPRNAMLTAAAPLLALLAAMRSGRARMNLPDLHRRTGEEIEAFGRRFGGRYSVEEVRRATYALAATADDIALNLPFKEAEIAEWAQRSLVVRFFHEAIGGDRFWRLLEEMMARPASHGAMLELYHACMGAGFEGRYRVIPGGRAQHEELMQQVFKTLDHPRLQSNLELSPHWRGQTVPAVVIGLWTRVVLVAAVAASALLIVYFGLHLALANTGRDARTAVRNLVPDEPLTLSRAAPAPPPPVSTQGDSIRHRLAARIQQGQVEVIDETDAIRVRTTVTGLFSPGSDHIVVQYDGLFREVAQALNAEPGDVHVEGHTDSDPVHGLTFTNNMQLSQARGDAAADIVRSALTDKTRKVVVEAYGDTRPLQDNNSVAGKNRNRRVEVVIQRSDR